MNKKFIKNKKGFMVLEILISAAIITVTILTATSVAQKSVSLSRQSLHTAQASLLLEEGAEAMRIVRDNAWTNVSTVGSNYFLVFSGGTWSLGAPSETIGIFSRKVGIENVYRDNATQDIVPSGCAGCTLDTGTKLVTLQVFWLEGATTITKELQFYLADIFS